MPPRPFPVLKCCYIPRNHLDWIISYCDPEIELDDFPMTFINESE